MKPVIIIAIAFVLVIPITVFAQEYQIYVQTDDTHYFKGDKIVVSGNVYPLIEDSFVSINLFLVDGGAIAVDLVTVAFDGNYTATFLPDILWEQGGDVIVSAGYYGEFTETKFNYSPEVELLENGCPVGIPYIWEDGLCHTTIERVYKEAEMGFYSNEKFDFSFEAPTNWNYQESVTIIEGRIDEVVFFPSEFHISNAGDDANMMDVQTAMMGWQWQFESPVIGIDFENIPTSKIKTMNENNIKDYYLDFVRETFPSAKMTDIYSKTYSYGWEVGVTYFVDVDLGLGQSIPYVGIDKAFFFKDREKYTLYYSSPEVYFDEYKPVYDHAVDTLTIKSVAVPEFGSIAMLILVSAIIPIILVSRKS